MALQLLLEVLDAVSEVGALAPDVLVAVCDLVQEPLDNAPAVAPEAASNRNVADLGRCKSHAGSPFYPSWPRIRMMRPLTIHSARIATIGEMSSGPSGGMNRRKMRRYGSTTS